MKKTYVSAINFFDFNTFRFITPEKVRLSYFNLSEPYEHAIYITAFCRFLFGTCRVGLPFDGILNIGTFCINGILRMDRNHTIETSGSSVAQGTSSGTTNPTAPVGGTVVGTSEVKTVQDGVRDAERDMLGMCKLSLQIVLLDILSISYCM